MQNILKMSEQRRHKVLMEFKRAEKKLRQDFKLVNKLLPHELVDQFEILHLLASM